MKTEIKNALTNFAIEDTDIVIKSGIMSITDTKSGVITMTFENDFFKVLTNDGTVLLENADRLTTIEFLINVYTVEEA